MDFGKIFDRKKNDAQGKNLEEIYKIKKEIEREDRVFENELAAKYNLLQEFTQDQLERLCHEIIGRGPPTEEYIDPKSGNKKSLPQFKEDYVHFITDEMSLPEIKRFALKNKIIAEEYFKN